MNEITINEKISYIEAAENPLSADIGIIQENHAAWLYDVGNGENPISELNGCYNVVLSHFHADHIGNIGRIQAKELFVSKETYQHIPKGTIASAHVNIVSDSMNIGNLHIFPLPSSHAKGSLGLEVDGTYAFVGDALYCKVKGENCVYNTQLLKEEINVLKNLYAPFLLVSHFGGLIRERKDVIEELEMIYRMRTQNKPEIWIAKGTK